MPEGRPGVVPDLGEFTPKDGTLYRPSNGTEGDFFQGRFCDHCKADAEFRKTMQNGCDILARSLACDVKDSDYPKEWIWRGGVPVCTAFDDEALQITNAEREAQAPLFEHELSANANEKDGPLREAIGEK